MDTINTINRHKKRNWKLLCWNVKGINSVNKWTAIKSKIQETSCDIICLQETKRELLDLPYIKNFCPPTYDSFEYVPSERFSGGIISFWKSTRFNAHKIFQNNFALSLELVSTMSGASWVLTNVYAPCTVQGRLDFLDWFGSIDMADDIDWLIVGDFNLIRKQSDINKQGGNITNMLNFNAFISNLRIEELKLHGNRFTWSNMQQSPF
jgi:exonuclease III